MNFDVIKKVDSLNQDQISVMVALIKSWVNHTSRY